MLVLKIIQKIIQNKPRITLWRIVGGGLLIVSGFVLTALLLSLTTDKTVAFHYQGEVCSRTLSVMPGTHKISYSKSFRGEFRDFIKVGSIPVVAKKLCFVPTKLPKQVHESITATPFGIDLMKQVYTIQASAKPSVSMGVFDKPVGTIADVSLPLSSPDEVSSYTLKVGARSSVCKKQVQKLNCSLASLQLSQNSTYHAELVRGLNDSSEVIVRKKIKTINAVNLSSLTVRNSIIYSVPNEFEISANKPLKYIDVTLTKKGTTVPIPVKVTIQGAIVKLSISSPLPRETEYMITASRAVAEDDSELEIPYVLTFQLSGGPKVSNVSIAASGVARDTSIELTFDQPISSQSIASFIHVEGVEARITAYSQKAIITLVRTPLCQRFSIKVGAGLISTSGVKNEQAWSYSSRITCHTTTTYGTSVGGRPLVVHYFGASGPMTMYVGAIHGNERSSHQLMQQWLLELDANPDEYEGKRIAVIPAINPDGLAANTRNNARNVNLNRNFPTDNWKSDINDNNGATAGGGGIEPLSEPEAQALARLTIILKPRLLLSFHAKGSLVVGDVSDSSALYATTYARLSRFRNTTGNSGTFNYEISGCYEDWASRFIGVPSLIIELETYTNTSFLRHKTALWAMLQT